MTDDTTDRIITEIDTLEADRGADSDEVGARSADDQFPWTDAARWSRGDEYGDLDEGCGYGDLDESDELSCIPWDVPGRVITLTAHLGDGRSASWSMLTGWSGDPCVVRAAQSVAELYSELGEMCAAARGLIGAAVDGSVNESCWMAARL